jgi:hypothetical protein
MVKSAFITAATLSSLLVLAMAACSDTVAGDRDKSIDEAVSRYARYGADVWARNPGARIAGEGEACISCHTSLPYALVEPLLPGPYPAYDDLMANINHRVLTWQDNTPWYSDAKLHKIADLSNTPHEILTDALDAEQSRGVEAIFNALIRSMHDAYAGAPARPETVQAVANMWAEQIQEGPAAGRWHWIQANLIPWEVVDSDLWGASLACVTATVFPELAPNKNLQQLHGSLREAASDEEVSLHVKSAILWCDAETGGRVLPDDTATRLVTHLLSLQHSNGGWALRELGPWLEWEGSSSDCCPHQDIQPDAYATGLVTLALARNRSFLDDDGTRQMAAANTWIEAELTNPYPAGPRHNRHVTGDEDLPEFRNQLYTNAGHMWAYLARIAHSKPEAPWSQNRRLTQAP